ncbi:heterokaryon incompatibility protein-domain-containing protein [Nemania serpens]|nr:heterokaryon incompatibility protein-domain-containing protein [Nemania serpens]
MDVGGGSKKRAFRYGSLEEDGMIRLLEVVPDNPLRVRVIHTRLRDALRYAALSYTWGENIFDHDLLIEDQVLHITKNLSDALIELTPFIIQQGLLLWVDAVCINQEDLDERGRQVSIMDKIYKSSDTVLAWLGKSTDQSDLAMNSISEWRHVTTALKPADNESWETFRSAFDKANADGLDLCGPAGSASAQAWLAILSLWGRSWWRRAWIVQEATALPNQRTVICCGNRKTDFQNMSMILNMRYYLFHENKEYDFLICSFEQGFADHLDILKIRMANGHQSLISILKHIRTYDCHDQRDKVFATINMASDLPPDTIRPDYTKTLSEVYIDVVRYLIKIASEGNCLDFLSHVIRPTLDWDRLSLPNVGIPSWVPDWRGPRVDIVEFQRGIDPQTGRPLYNASGNTLPVFSINGSQLQVDGILVDTIKTTTTIATNTRPLDTQAERSWLPDDGDVSYIAGGTVGEAFNHAMVADIGSMDGKLLPDGRTANCRGCSVDWELLGRPDSTLGSDDAQRRMLLANRLTCTTTGRRIFRTEKGFVGLGPAAARVGDSVCVLLGGQMMYALRPVAGEHHEFIGECYVHGLMDGEALGGAESDSPERDRITTFVLV